MANRRLRRELLETVRDLHAAGAIDVKKMQEFSTFRVVRAPEPYAPPSVPLPSNSVVSVALNAEERVDWIWTTDRNGASYVTGYKIIKAAVRRRKVRRRSPNEARPR